MRISWEDDIDGLQTWDDVAACLAERWREVLDRGNRVLLTTHFDDLLVHEPPAGTATQRRMLHRHGFRRMDERCWSWTPAAPPAGDLPPPPPRLPASTAARWTSLALDRAVDRARSDMALRVLREVYRSTPDHLVVTVVGEDEEWDDEDDDEVPGLDCAAR